ncbi:hypothetical protein DPSP01_002897 [Paraphaeosphaeria sporulosa]
MATNFTFVHVSDPATNPKPEESQQIRSRCMQGKNNREDSHRSIRERKRREKQAMEDMQVVQTSMRPPTPMLSADTLISDLSLVRFAGPDIDAEAKGSKYLRLYPPHSLEQPHTYNVVLRTTTPRPRTQE